MSTRKLEPPDESVTINHNGNAYHGWYKVESGVLQLWVAGPDGPGGPMSVVLRGMPQQAARQVTAARVR